MEKNVIKWGRVVNNKDPYGGGRIQVKLMEDSGLDIGNMLWCQSLLPKHIHIVPKEGELCLVLSATGIFTGDDDRFYIGPIISQIDKISGEDSKAASAFMKAGMINVRSDPYRVKNADGVYPETNGGNNISGSKGFGDVIGFLGRDNTDIITRNNEMWIRVNTSMNGSGNEKERKIFSKNVGYLMLKRYDGFTENGEVSPQQYGQYDPLNPQNEDVKTISYETTATLVANEINLISSSPQAKKTFNTNDNHDMISDSEMKNILEKAHRLPYGDILVEFLQLFKNAFINHTHTGMTELKPVAGGEGMGAFLDFDLPDILSNNIRIN
jgi:hypothetical protein